MDLFRFHWLHREKASKVTHKIKPAAAAGFAKAAGRRESSRPRSYHRALAWRIWRPPASAARGTATTPAQTGRPDRVPAARRPAAARRRSDRCGWLSFRFEKGVLTSLHRIFCGMVTNEIWRADKILLVLVLDSLRGISRTRTRTRRSELRNRHGPQR